jgi:chemotaxis protein MotA
MPTSYSALFDPGALSIVVTGTVLACAARCGWRDFGAALKAAGGLARRDFNAGANRKALALAVTAIQRDGPHRADPALPPDRALGLMLEAYLRHGSLEALHMARRSQRALAEARRVSAVQVFVWAGELAPVFGLVGTLYAFTQLAPVVGEDMMRLTMAAIATSVLSTLYGALLAHLLCYPLASAIERRGLADEQARAELSDWFAGQLGRPVFSPQERPVPLRGVA